MEAAGGRVTTVYYNRSWNTMYGTIADLIYLGWVKRDNIYLVYIPVGLKTIMTIA